MPTFYNDVIQHSPYFNLLSRVAYPDLLEPVFRTAIEAMLAESAANGIPLMLFESYRSVPRQELLFSSGASQLQHVGLHHYGLAADLVRQVDGQPSWHGDFGFLGTLAKKHGMIWGGDWGRQPDATPGFVDAYHVQRVTLVDQARVLNNTWYPPADYAAYPNQAAHSDQTEEDSH